MIHAAQSRICVAVLALACIGCGREAAPPPPVPAEDAEPIATAPQEAVSMSGINLFMHDARPTAGATRKPTFSVHADYFAMLDDQVWSFENARAAIYGQDAQQEEVRLQAARGRFEEDRGAFLEGGVSAFVGDMTMELANIEWINPREEGEEGVARSDNELRVNSPSLQLHASSLRLYPESKRFVLTNVEGMVRFGGTMQ